MNNYFKYLLFFVLVSCGRELQLSEVLYQYEKIGAEDQIDSQDKSIEEIIIPYRTLLNKEMNVVLAHTIVPLEKMKPEGRLGNFLADLLLEEVQEELTDSFDLCVLNYGGMRIPIIDSGDITLSLVYELMPFDNTIVVSEVKGSDLGELFSYLVEKGGWPLSKSVEILVDGDGGFDAMIHGKKLDPNRTYHLVTNNYIANGGDGCSFMTTWKNTDTGWLIRDKIIEHLNELTEKDGVIYSELTSRIVFFK